MRKTFSLATLLVALATFGSLSHSIPGYATTGQAATKSSEQLSQELDTRLRKNCKQLCIEARTASEVSRCVQSHENLQGTDSFKTDHPGCFEAKQNYEAFLQHQRDLNQPSRYG